MRPPVTGQRTPLGEIGRRRRYAARCGARPTGSRGRPASSRPGGRPPRPRTCALDVVGELGELADEPVPAGDLERYPRHLPRPRGGLRGRSIRPTWSTKIRVAPSSTARPTGMECTRPPSRKCSPSISAGGSRPGTAAQATTASTSGPGRTSAPRSARCWPRTHWNGTARSAKVRSPSSVASAAQRLGGVQVGAGGDRAAAVRSGRSPYTSRLTGGLGPQVGEPVDHRGVGLAATTAPLRAPTLVPSTRSGVMPRSKGRGACRPRRHRGRRHRRGRTRCRCRPSAEASGVLGAYSAGGAVLGPEGQERDRPAEPGSPCARMLPAGLARARRPRTGRSCRASHARSEVGGDRSLSCWASEPSVTTTAWRGRRLHAAASKLASGTDQVEDDQEDPDDGGHHPIRKVSSEFTPATLPHVSVVSSPERPRASAVLVDEVAHLRTARSRRTPTTRGRRRGCGLGEGVGLRQRVGGHRVEAGRRAAGRDVAAVEVLVDALD